LLTRKFDVTEDHGSWRVGEASGFELPDDVRLMFAAADAGWVDSQNAFAFWFGVSFLLLLWRKNRTIILESYFLKHVISSHRLANRFWESYIAVIWCSVGGVASVQTW
jgi:hypothetical protein